MDISVEELKSQARSSKFILLLVFLALIGIYALYVIYIWSYTQTTDNAYADSNISKISAQISGVLDEILVEENNFVTKGQVIAKINDEIFQAHFKKAQGAVDAAKKECESVTQRIVLNKIKQQKLEEIHKLALESFRIHQADLKRTKELSRDSYTSKQYLDSVQIAFDKSQSNLVQTEFDIQLNIENLKLLEIKSQAATSQYEITVAERALAKNNLDKTEVRSPINGMLADSSLRVGNYASAGRALFLVVPTNKLFVKANYKETQVAKFKPGMKAALTFDAYGSTKITGTIQSISPATGAKYSLIPPENATGNFTKVVQRVIVKINFDTPNNLQNKILPGMSCLVKIRTD